MPRAPSILLICPSVPRRPRDVHVRPGRLGSAHVSPPFGVSARERKCKQREGRSAEGGAVLGPLSSRSAQPMLTQPLAFPW